MAEPSAHTYDPTYFRAQGWWRDETLGGWLERCAASRDDRAAVMIGRQSFSYEDLKARVDRFRVGAAPDRDYARRRGRGAPAEYS